MYITSNRISNSISWISYGPLIYTITACGINYFDATENYHKEWRIATIRDAMYRLSNYITNIEWLSSGSLGFGVGYGGLLYLGGGNLLGTLNWNIATKMLYIKKVILLILENG